MMIHPAAMGRGFRSISWNSAIALFYGFNDEVMATEEPLRQRDPLGGLVEPLRV
jgi:hypothetical protein